MQYGPRFAPALVFCVLGHSHYESYVVANLLLLLSCAYKFVSESCLVCVPISVAIETHVPHFALFLWNSIATCVRISLNTLGLGAQGRGLPSRAGMYLGSCGVLLRMFLGRGLPSKSDM